MTYETPASDSPFRTEPAARDLAPQFVLPLVVRLDGTSVEAGRAILNELNHPLVTQVDTMDGAAAKAAELAAR